MGSDLYKKRDGRIRGWAERINVDQLTAAIRKNGWRYLYLVFSFAALDMWLRAATRWIGFYGITEPAPNLFTLLWSVFLAAMVTLPKSRRTGRCLYGVLYLVFWIYAIVQYGSWLVLGKFLYVSDFLFAGEGADYTSWVVDILTLRFVVYGLALLLIGTVGIWLFPEKNGLGNHPRRWRAGLMAGCLLLMTMVPDLYGDESDLEQWNAFSKVRFEYEHFTNANYDMELTGMYQFLVHDSKNQLTRRMNREAEIPMIDAFFAEKPDHQENEMTGIFAGKNMIVVMMETMDDWLITETDTPTIYKMMSDGINFTNFHTPGYSNGYTFNTEFAFHNSVYPYSNGNVAYSLTGNTFSNSIAARFADAGYEAHSYHLSEPNFYRRGEQHRLWGYEAYHTYYDYPDQAVIREDDRFLAQCDELYTDLTNGAPFFSFVITYSPHIPYTDEDQVSQAALAAYPEYDVQEDREVSILRAKARLTDDMFAGLLRRLEEDGILEDTVIVGFTDHYAYGLSDPQLLQQYSEAAGSSILERTPAFIYCADRKLAMEVDQVAQITDLAPTILNLFGLEVHKEVMGQDVFDDNYEGFAIFAGNTWLTDTVYVKNGEVVWNHGVTDDEIEIMNAYVQQVYRVNDAILDADYYAAK